MRDRAAGWLPRVRAQGKKEHVGLDIFKVNTTMSRHHAHQALSGGGGFFFFFHVLFFFNFFFFYHSMFVSINAFAQSGTLESS